MSLMQSFIPAIGIEIKNERGDPLDNIQWDVLTAGKVNREDLHFVPAILNNKEAMDKIGELEKVFSPDSLAKKD